MNKIIKIVISGILCEIPLVMSANKAFQAQESFDKARFNKIVGQRNNEIYANAINMAALSTRKEINEKIYTPYRNSELGNPNNIYVIQGVIDGVNGVYARLPTAVQAVDEIRLYTYQLRTTLQDEKVKAAFAILELPVGPIGQKTIERALRKKLNSSKPGVLIPKSQRGIYFDAADTIKESKYFTYGEVTKVRPASDKDYTLLGIPKGASRDVIKKAYRQATFKYHPDKFAINEGQPGYECTSQAQATEKTQEIHNAYERLMKQFQ
ncbi:MAG: J domain-containing protein [Puniceicoccales bacterium]|jgi:hypothetical protein|nr:J domain-containing protein [Puniceicoccales bacterium]